MENISSSNKNNEFVLKTELRIKTLESYQNWKGAYIPAKMIQLAALIPNILIHDALIKGINHAVSLTPEAQMALGFAVGVSILVTNYFFPTVYAKIVPDSFQSKAWLHAEEYKKNKESLLPMLENSLNSINSTLKEFDDEFNKKKKEIDNEYDRAKKTISDECTNAQRESSDALNKLRNDLSQGIEKRPIQERLDEIEKKLGHRIQNFQDKSNNMLEEISNKFGDILKYSKKAKQPDPNHIEDEPHPFFG